MKIKKWGLLKDGSIEVLYYSDGELRNIEKYKGKMYLNHDVYLKNNQGEIIAQAYCRHEIIKQSDDINELLELRERNEN